MPGRVFVAIDLAPGTVRLLAEAADAYVAAAPDWSGEKWVAPRLFHVTLAFLGEVPDPALDALVDSLAARVARIPEFALTLDDVRAAPSRSRATMVWATLEDPSGACAELAASVVAGSRTEHAPATRGHVARHLFRPHVTLCRARAPRTAPQVAAEAASAALLRPGKDPDRSVSVHSATLYASTLGLGGPSYAPLGSIALRGD